MSSHNFETRVSSPLPYGSAQDEVALAKFAREFADEIQAELLNKMKEQEELRKSEELYRDFFENAQEAIYVHDLRGRYRMVNRATEELLGYSCEELSKLTVFDICAPEYLSRIGLNLKRKLEHHAPTTYEVELQTKHGGRVPVEICSRLIYENGIPVGVQGTARDISERKRSELALRESEERYRTVTESANDAIITVDEDIQIQLVNQAAGRIFGYKPEEMLGQPLTMLIPQHFRDAQHTALAEYLASERKNVPWGTFELPGLHRNGREIQLELSFSECKEQGKKFFTAIARDISDRKKAETVLRESEERLRGLFENARDIVFTCDLAGSFTSLNAAGEQLTGYSRSEALELNFTRVVAPEYLQVAKDMLERKAGGDVASIYELEIITKQGERVLVEISSRTLHSDGRAIGVQGSVRDITTRKRDEEALRRSEEQYRMLFDNNPQPMWVYDLETLAFLAVNDAAIKHYGYSRNTFLSMTLNDLHPAADAARLIVCARNIDRLVHCGEWRHCTASGETIDVEITANVIDFANRRAGLVLANDLTQRKTAEKALRASEVQLQQSQKLEAIGQLAGGVAHDFNNLLTAIAGYSDLTLRRLAEEDPLRGNLTEIIKATERAASLTRQLLAFSRKQILEPKILDLNAVVKDMSRMLRRLIGEDFELVTDLAADLARVKADPGQVEQIIMNLVVNARDAMPQGGKVRIKTENVVVDETYASHHMPMQPGEYTMLAISDTGTGMDRETQSHVFEPFFTTKSAGKGTGLGLSTVYGIVKQSGGYVWVYSEVDNGTVFKVYLPRVSGGVRDEKSMTSTTDALRGSETILLVEDEEIVRRMARMILESSGYTVLEAGDVKDALRLCYENVSKIDLMLTDVIMPGMSGRLLAERVAVLCPDLRVIYMSGYTDDAIMRHGILEEDIVFLQKPFTRDSLLIKVREAVNNTLMAV